MSETSHQFESFFASVQELTLKRETVESVPYWDKSRHKKFRFHRAAHLPLLADLARAIHPTGGLGGDGGRSRPGSRPGARLDAIDGMTKITAGARLWVTRLGGTPRATVVHDLGSLVGLAGGLTDEMCGWLALDARGWVTLARVVSGWQTPAFAPHAPCPQCERVGGLRIRLEERVGVCLVCGADWVAGDGGIFVLADHVRLTTEDAS